MTNLLLIATLVLEAACDGKQGMEAVHEVIYNRACHFVRSGNSYEHAIIAVIKQPKQFSCMNGITSQEAIKKAQQDTRSWNLAEKIVSSRLSKHVGRATHYHARYIKRPKWSYKLKYVGTVGQHMFYE